MALSSCFRLFADATKTILKRKKRSALSSRHRRLRAELLEDRRLLTHFRYGTIDWTATGNTVTFHLTEAWRASYWNQNFGVTPTANQNLTGSPAQFNFGDGTSAAINLFVTSVTPAEDSFVGTATLTHTYATAGNRIAYFEGGNRISTLKNDADGLYRNETRVDLLNFPGNSSPVTSLPSILQVPDNQIYTVQIPGTDPNNDAITYRLSTVTGTPPNTFSAEAAGFNGGVQSGSGGAYTHPGNLSISSTGLITWDIRDVGGLATVAGDRWTTQIMIEDHSGGVNGPVKSKVPVDFILQVASATNHAPAVVASPAGPFQPVAGQTLNFTVTASDQDSADTVTNLVALNPPPGMTFTPFGSAGNPKSITASYTPTQAQANQTFVVTFQATDNHGLTGLTSVTITPAANQPPAAVGDSYSTNEDVPLIVAAPGVRGNDSDPENNAFTSVIVANPSHGLVTLNPNGSFTYTPDQDYFGPDSFTYHDIDAAGSNSFGNTATVNLTVNAVNDAPVLVNDSATTDEDVAVDVPVLANDAPGPTNESPQTLSVTKLNGISVIVGQVVATAHGTVVLNANGTVKYTPALDYNGSDAFTYTAADNGSPSQSASASGTVIINPVNDPPVARPDFAATNEDTSVVIPILANDSDVDNALNPASVVITLPPAHGSLSLNPTTGAVTYSPVPNYNGMDAFSYTVADVAGAVSGIANVTVRIDPVNDQPVASDDDYSTDEDVTLTIDAPGVLANDSDVEGDGLSSLIVTFPSHGVLTLGPDGSFIYVPDTNYHGLDSFTYRANDSAPGTVAVVRLTIHSVNDAPFTSTDEPDEIEVDEGETASASGKFSDDDGDVVSLTATVGVVTKNDATGTWSWSLDTSDGPDESQDVFIFADDGNGGTSVTSFELTVENVDPTANDDAATTDEDTAVTVDVLANDTDPAGANDPLTVTSVTQGAHGSVSINGDGTVTYTPAPNYNGADSFTYSIDDGDGGTATGTVNITVDPVNDFPQAFDDSYDTNEDTVLTIVASGVLINDSDVDGDPLTVVGYYSPSHGTLSIFTDGSFSYTPAPDFNGTDSFIYKIWDGHGSYTHDFTPSTYATVTINVAATNDAPTVTNDGDQTVDEGQTATNSGSFADIDSPTVTITASVGSIAQSGASNGAWSWSFDSSSPNESQTVIITADDQQGGISTTTFALTVRDVLPSIQVSKSVSPAAVSEGGVGSQSVTYTYTVTNTSIASTDPVTIDSLTDSVLGSLAGSGTCQVGTVLAPQASCSFTVTTSVPTKNAGDTQVNTFTATGSDDENNPVSDSATATVTYTDVLPSLSVTKTASVVSVSEGGVGNQVVTYTYVVTNTSSASTDPVTVSSVFDNVLGEQLTAPVMLPVGGSISLTATTTVPVKNAGATQDNTVTVSGKDDENDLATATASASVAYTDVQPSLSVTKTASVVSVSEGGVGNQLVTYTYVVTNTSSASTDPVTVSSVFDSVLGEQLAAPVTLPVGGSITLTVTTTVPVKNAGATQDNTVTVSGKDDENDPATATASASVGYTDVLPSLSVTKTASVVSVSEGGVGNQVVTYTYVVTNTSSASTDPVTVSSVFDNVLGEQLTAPVTLPVGGSITLTVTTTVPVKNAGATQDNTVTVSGKDDENNPATATASASVGYTDVLPSLSVTKTASATTIDEGGSVTYTYVVTNTSAASTDPVTVTSVNDDRFGELLITPITLIPGASTTLTKTVTYSDNAVVTNIVTVSGRDDENDAATATASITVTINNVAPVLVSIGNNSTCCSSGMAVQGNSVTVSGIFTDVGTGDTHIATINWGDNTPATAATITESGGSGSLTGSHVYPAGGIYIVTVTVRDDDGAISNVLTTSVYVSGAGVLNGTLYVIGTNQDDHVTINATGNGYYKVHAGFVADKDFSSAGVAQIVVVLCDGNDDATISAGINVPVILDGGNGNDKLNGGNGPNIILGGNGNDDINGGSSRDLLIGGAGADRIVGNSQEDIMIAGTTAHDSNYAALSAIMTEWLKDDASHGYAQRVANLSSGGSAAYLLIGDDSVNQTVFNDNDVDKLTGSAGSDWFFANLVADGGGALDTVTDKGASEIWSDTDF